MAGGCAGDVGAIVAILKPALDATVSELLPGSCTLQANGNGTVSRAQHPKLPVVQHFDAFDRHRPLFFCCCPLAVGSVVSSYSPPARRLAQESAADR